MPIGRAPACLDGAWLGFTRLGGSAATGAVLQGRWQGLFGLVLQGLLEEFAAEGLGELHHQLFQIGEGRTPGKPLRAVEVEQQVFGRGVQDRTQLGRNLYHWGSLCHVELLS